MVKPMIVFTFWLGGMEDGNQVGFSSLTETGNQTLKFKDADVAGVCGAGLLVLCRKGAPGISGGISLSHWLKKISCTCKEETSQNLAMNNTWEGMTLTVNQRQRSSDKQEWEDFLGTQELSQKFHALEISLLSPFPLRKLKNKTGKENKDNLPLTELPICTKLKSL